MKYVLIFMTAVFLSLTLTSMTSAHSYVEASDPEEDATTEEAVETITLFFDAGIESATTATVIDEEGNEVEIADETIEEGQEYIATLTEPLASGDYTVKWQALGDDGHTTDGQVAFSVGAAEAVEEEAMEEEDSTEEAGAVEEETTTDEASEEEETAADGAIEGGNDGGAGWMITGVLIVIIAGSLIFFISRNRRAA